VNPRYLLDTNILIAVIRNRAANAKPFLIHHESQIATSTITAYELWVGALRAPDVATASMRVERVLSLVQMLDFDLDAAKTAADVRAKLQATGNQIGPYDTLIAGLALSRDLIVVTSNEGEFRRVDGLTVENWLAN